MASLAELPEVIGFFSYSREDNEAFKGTLSTLRKSIQGELGARLGRSRQTFRLWQDEEAIPAGKLWEAEIKAAVAQSVFFIPIVTPRAINSPHCKFEFEAFLARERALGRSDLIFPILYIDVPALERETQWRNHPVLSIVGARQYVDWRTYRLDVMQTTEERRAIGRLCGNIFDALHAPWSPPAERESQAQSRTRLEIGRSREDADATRAEGEDAPRPSNQSERQPLPTQEQQEPTEAPPLALFETYQRQTAAALKRVAEERPRREPLEKAQADLKPRRTQWPSRRVVLLGSACLLALIGVWLVAAPPAFSPWPQPQVTAAGELRLVGADALAFSGPQGGPFNPAKIQFDLKAVGRGFRWSTDQTPPWLDVTPNEDDLSDNGSVPVEATLAPAAQSLAVGSYEGKLAFKNHVGGSLTTRTVSLVIAPKPPAIVAMPEPVLPISVPTNNDVPLSAERERALKAKDSFRECPTCPEMMVMPTGSFNMGSPDTQPLRDKDEGPLHVVTIRRPFAVGKFAITFDEWDACADDGGCNGYHPGDPEGWGRAKRPVIFINWNDARAYVAWLSRKTGKAYRLLSEAEREYVTRAGTTTPFWFGNSISLEQANFGSGDAYSSSTSGFRKQTVPVGTFPLNPWGLDQVHGNIREWTEDCYNSSYADAPIDGSPWLKGDCARRVLRNGSWVNMSALLRSAFRGTIGNNDLRSDTIGFRVARTLLAP
jgi:formylglycine-generating enzyme required for sulfatase activity